MTTSEKSDSKLHRLQCIFFFFLTHAIHHRDSIKAEFDSPSVRVAFTVLADIHLRAAAAAGHQAHFSSGLALNFNCTSFAAVATQGHMGNAARNRRVNVFDYNRRNMVPFKAAHPPLKKKKKRSAYNSNQSRWALRLAT